MKTFACDDKTGFLRPGHKYACTEVFKELVCAMDKWFWLVMKSFLYHSTKEPNNKPLYV